MGTFIALIAAIGVGSIISAFIGHHVAISGHRQAWINALRDDIAEFIKLLDRMAYALRDWMKDSTVDANEEKRRAARMDLLFVYERIRLRLNREEESHVALEQKLSEFMNEPILANLEDRSRIDEVITQSRQILKNEWEVTKYPWRSYFTKAKKLLRRQR